MQVRNEGKPPEQHGAARAASAPADKLQRRAGHEDQEERHARVAQMRVTGFNS